MMFSRALLVALCIVYATSLTPLTAPADDDCALYLTGPGRSSAYDYSLNLLKGNFAYDGQHTCITYEAINQAYLDARTRILVSQPKGDWKGEDFASVGELILDISISLARTYGLTYEEIEKGLPLIDTTRTLIREVCPPVFSHVECRAGKYRRLDGLCNNLRHPTWGATMAPFQRLIGPLFSDGINAPRISHTGHDLPLSRVVSRTMHPDEGFHDHAGTVMVIAWGQFMDHDYTLTGTPLDPVHRNDPEECCKRPPHLKHPYCNEIRVPDDDYFYRLFGVKCIDFVRGFPSPRPGCRLGSRVPFNTLTGALDGNTVYGVTEKFARKLRTGYGGLLRMNPVFKEYGLKDLLPLKLDIPDEGCTRPNKNMYCFEAGEIRVNEQLVLTVMHTLMAREHNRVAEALAAVNPHWDDETLFQEARRINIAEIQHITYNEFLPILLGKDVMEKFGLVLAKEGYWEGYDQEVNPDVIASFAAAAYRFGHSLLPTAVERWSKAHKFIASKRLSDLIRRPYDLYRAGVLDEYVMGLMNQVAQAMDDSITQEVTNHLFKKVGARFGMDLVSFNMQRGREFGLPGYMEFRKFCGLSGADTFQDLFGSMANETIRKYESIFEHPIDVDLWSGGVSERPLPGSMLGPTFACIIATQFSYSRRGDRFWFELPNQPSSFTPEQLAEIRKSRLARVICDNTDIIDTVQLYPMVLPDHELNPRVPCRSGIIPSMDFTKWADPVPILGGAKEYMTGAYTLNETTYQNNQTGTTCDNAGNEICASNKTNQDNSNKTNNITSTKENNNLSCLQFQNNTKCLISSNKNNCKLGDNCTNVLSNQSDSVVKQIADNNTLLKYVYKKGDNTKNSKKSRGHIKNSLKRKRRSLNRNVDKTQKTIAPGFFNVLADQNNERTALNIPKLNSDNIIKNSNLADFEIETLHNTNRPRNNKLYRGSQKHYNLENNQHYLPKHTQNKNTNNENISYQGDEYETVIKDKNEKGPNIIAHRQNQHRDLNNKHYLPETRQENEKSKEDNTSKESSSYEEDELHESSDENNKSIESLRENIKHPNNISQRGNLRYYKDRKKKYYISKPKQVDDENSENVSGEEKNISDKIEPSIQGNDDDDDEDDHDEKFRSEKQNYHDDIENTDKSNFWDEDEDDDDDKDDEIFDRREKSHGHKQVTNSKLRQPYNERYHNEKQNRILPESKIIPENNEKYGRSDVSSSVDEDDEYQGDEDSEDDEDNEDDEDSEDDEDDEIPIEKLKTNRELHINKQSPNNILQSQNQIYYNDKKIVYPLTASNEKNLQESDEKYERTVANKDDYEDKETVENFENVGNLHVNKKSPINILQKPNQIHNSDKRGLLTESKRIIEKDDINYNRKGHQKEQEHQNHEDNDRLNESFNNDGGLYENKQSPHILLQKQNQIYYKDKKDEYPLLKPKKLNEASDEQYERRNKIKNTRQENEYHHNEDGGVSIDNFSNNRDVHKNKQSPETVRRQNKIHYNNRKNSLSKFDENSDVYKRKDTNKENKYGGHDEKLVGNFNGGLHSNNKITPLHSSRITNTDKINADEVSLKYASNQIDKRNEKLAKSDIQNKFNNNKQKYRLRTTDKPIYSDYTNLKSNFNDKTTENTRKQTQLVNEEHKINPLQQNLNKSDIQEVDLDDFSYERIKLNDDGKIASAEDLHAIYDFLATSTISPNFNEQLYSKGTTSNTNNSKKFEKQVQINDGETKPVVELNIEHSSEKNLNSDKDSENPNGGTYREINSAKGDDVKQQFERIPINYKHAGSNTTKNIPPVKNDESEGTLDTLSPEIKKYGSNSEFQITPDKSKYDENLKIKFDDINIKLPEIKLPDDILAYTQEGHESNKDNIKPSDYIYYNRDPEQHPEEPKTQKIIDNNYHHYDPKDATLYSQKPKAKEAKNDGEYDFFASYITKPHENVNDKINSEEASNENNESVSGEDLYEKFVRERFGRKNNFKERSEKLQEKKLQENKPTAKNHELFETIQKAIKKAEEVQKEAEKSGDPNASYLWTLEYGEKV